MKKINFLLIIMVALGLFSSCEDEAFGPAVGEFKAPQLTAPTGGTFVLTEEIEDDTLTTFFWSAAGFGFDSEVTYTVQLDEAGNNFNDAIDISSTFLTQASVTVGKVNNHLLTAGYPFNTEGDFVVRIKAKLHDDVDVLYSSLLALKITPFEKIVIYPMLWVPGSYQGWAPDVAPNVFSLKSNDKYEGYVNFPTIDNAFKFTPAPNWDNTYGDADVSGTTGIIDGAGNGNDIKIITLAGYYKLNIDLIALTYSTLRTDWGLIGSSVPPYDWGSDVDMIYDAGTGVWSVTLDLVGGVIKFRANDGWDLNYGSDNANGILNAGGTDIPVPDSGNYTIVLDLNGPLYRYTITKN